MTLCVELVVTVDLVRSWSYHTHIWWTDIGLTIHACMACSGMVDSSIVTPAITAAAADVYMDAPTYASQG